MADKLNMHYVTWRQSLDLDSSGEPRTADLLLADTLEAQHKPFKTRYAALQEFLKENRVAPSETRDFMEHVVAPWANQGMIAHLIQSDYDAMNRDNDIKEGKPFENKHGDWRKEAPQRKKALQQLGGVSTK